MASEHPNEAGLIALAQRGNLEAFNDLILHYQDRAYSLAYRIMGDSPAAADSTQDAFINAYQKINAYRGGSFKAWLFRIVTNTCYDELRRRKRRPVTPLDDLPGGESDDGPALPTDAPTPEQAVQQRELAAAIEQCIAALHEDQRAVLVLSDVEGLPYQEIAVITGANLGTVKSRLSRARAGVRQCLAAVQELLPVSYRLRE
jgi:RNA polymerase sigma-70 factor (ECF subfamily)